MDTMYYIGLDVHKKTISYCASGELLLQFVASQTGTSGESARFCLTSKRVIRLVLMLPELCTNSQCRAHIS